MSVVYAIVESFLIIVAIAGFMLFGYLVRVDQERKAHRRVVARHEAAKRRVEQEMKEREEYQKNFKFASYD